MSFEDIFPNGSRATLRAQGAELVVDVLGFEFPDALEGLDAQWLLARVTWQGAGGKLQCEGPLFMIDELLAWGHAAIAQDDSVRVSFVEPNVQFACMSQPDEQHVVRLALLAESKGGNTHLETRLRVTNAELAAFGRRLVEIARFRVARRARRGKGVGGTRDEATGAEVMSWRA